MPINTSPWGSTMEEQLSSIMEVLSKAAVSEISQLFSEGSASLRLQISQSLKENEALRSRMKGMRSELVSLRLQTRSNAARAKGRFALARANVCKPRTKSLGNGLQPPMNHKAVGNSTPPSPSKSELTSVPTPSEETPDIILIKDEEDIGGGTAADFVDSGDRSTPCGVATESRRADAAVSSNMAAAHSGELRILSVYGRGGGLLAADGHDTLFTASELEALSSLSPDPSLTHDSLLGSHSGPSQRVPAPGGRGGPGRGGQVERLQRLQAAAPEAQDPGRGAVPFDAQFQLQDSLEFPPGGGAQGLDFHERLIIGKEPTGYRDGTNGATPILCAFCGKSLANKAKLRMHMRIHTGERPYGCGQCGKRFTQSGSLKIHLRTHSGEKPCVCLHCHARFSDPSSHRRHMMKHASDGGL